MKIEHIALFVQDLERARDFFVQYFGAHSNALYQNPESGFCSYFLSFDDGARLEIMTKPGVQAADRQAEQMGYAHIAFSLGSAEQVLHMTEVLRNDGYPVISEPRTTGDGYFESCILDLEGNRIELTV